MDWQKSPWFKVVLVICCCGLFFLLLMILDLNRKEEQEFIRQIQQETGKVEEESPENTGEEQGTDVSETTTEVTPEGIPADETETGQDVQVPDENRQEVLPADTVEGVQGISFRGDSFCGKEDIPEKGLGACMRQILEQNGKAIPVVDYTMYKASSMSHMKLAGVAAADIDSYLAKHQELANEQTLRVTDVKIRELTDEQMIRTDQGYIPVICVGYYGGWVGDLAELCEQQQKILDTYQQKEKYLVLGVKPAGFSDVNLYLETMSAYWGEHFLSACGLQHSISSDEGKIEAAQLVYDKMAALGYMD